MPPVPPAAALLLPACLLAAALAACGPAPAGAGFGPTPLLTSASESGALSLAVYSDPQPPVRGNLQVRFRVTGDAGAPVDGLTLAVVPWMNAMGHGTSVTPTVTARGDGVYDLDDVYLFMPGQWTLRTSFSGTVSDRATPELQVQ